MKMIVWVATHYWDNEVNEGSKVLGVFKNHDRAYKEIENAAEIERKTESDDFWDCDCTWAEGDEIHLGHSIFCAGTCVCICIRLGDGGTSDLYRDGHVYHLYGYVPYPCDMWRINTRHSG